ncbi:SDR family oxidoreductase [Alcanivorax sp. 24]|uniref:SDR family NAD(P)-dependent oxidoreductase n=1 Tax=Alcanivorax sp. 24 TaxID=2545266 RepID=UPI00105F0414|nr:SDR family NAD(P)-dependent oxidoreductase [Alcanivorax sp. 24]
MSGNADTVTLITGAASGLGWALAQVAFQRGHRLILVDRDAEALADKSARLAATDPQRVTYHTLDLTDGPARDRLVDRIAARGRLDVLINNAGITHRSLAARTDPKVFHQVMAVDWEAPVALTLGCLPLLRDSGGCVINIGSMAGWMPVLGRAGYCSAKAALAQFFEVLRGEVADQGIDVLMVYPSFLATPIERNALGHDGGPAAHARSSVGRVRSAEWMAERVWDAFERGDKRLFPDRFTFLASLLWRLAPDLYHRLMRRRFAMELDS